MLAAALRNITASVSPAYAVDARPSCLAGPWNVFSATQKSTGQPVSVFVFDRKTISSNPALVLGGRSGPSSSKAVHDVIHRLRKEAANLAKLRHPGILRLIEPVEDTRTGGLMFVTERVTTSLETLLDDLDRHAPEADYDGDSVNADQNSTLGPVEIQKGLVQIGKSLEFLHYTAQLVHGNLTPSSILVDSKGDWKLSGFAFTGPENVPASDLTRYHPELPDRVQLDLRYASPDLIIDSNVTYATDIFSLGLLIVALYKTPHTSPIDVSPSDVSSYRRIFSSPSSTPSRMNRFLCSSDVLPPPILDLLSGIITRSPAQRLTAQEFQQAQFFDNILVSTLRFLDDLPAKSQAEKSQFMRGLPRVLSQFSASILEKNFIPALAEQIRDPAILSLALQCIFKILIALPVTSARPALVNTVLPRLHDMLLARDTSPERRSARDGGLTIVVNNMAILSKSTQQPQFKQHVLPLYLAAVQSNTHALVDAALQHLKPVLSSVDFLTLKNDIFPPVSLVFSKTNSLVVKVSALNALRLLCGGDSDKSSSQAVLDKFTIQEKVVPMLRGIKTKEPPVMMATLLVFQEVGKIADARFIATEVIPSLWSFALGPLLNFDQFQQFVSLINALSGKVIEEHGRSLKEITDSSDPFSRLNADPLALGQDDPAEEIDFNSLVLGKKGAGTIVQPAVNGFLSASSNGSSILRPNSSPAAGVISMTPIRQSTSAASALAPLVPQKPPAHRSITPTPSSQASTTIDWSGAKKPININSLGRGTASNSVRQTGPAQLASFPALQPMKPPPSTTNQTLGLRNNNRSLRQASGNAFSIPPPPATGSQGRSNYASQPSLLDE